MNIQNPIDALAVLTLVTPVTIDDLTKLKHKDFNGDNGYLHTPNGNLDLIALGLIESLRAAYMRFSGNCHPDVPLLAILLGREQSIETAKRMLRRRVAAIRNGL